MPLPAGMPLPEYQVQCGKELPSAEATVELEPTVTATHAITIKLIGRNRRTQDMHYGSTNAAPTRRY